MAVAKKVAVAPGTTVASAGWAEIAGAIGAAPTVRIAEVLVASGATPLLATALNAAFEQAIGTAARESVVVVAPETEAPVQTPLPSTPLLRSAPSRRH